MRQNANKLLTLLCILALSGCSAILGFDEFVYGGDGDADSDTDTDTDTDTDSDSDDGCTDDDECGDDIECTEDSCDDDGLCVHHPDDSACGAGETPPLCRHWVCDPEADDADDEGCAAAPDAEGTSCEGEFPCYDGETCDGEGECVESGGEDRNCADAFACTVDSCDEVSGECAHDPDDDVCPESPEGAPGFCDPEHPDVDGQGCVFGTPCDGDAECDDSLVCNGEESCVGGYCRRGAALECDDDIECTVDTCDDTTVDGCVNTPDDSFCDTDNACSIDTCVAGSGCRSEEVVCAPDGNPCTYDRCDSDFGGCYPPAPNTTSCDEVFACLDGEHCDGDGECDATTGTPTDCDDDNPCTDDTCSEPAGCNRAPVPNGRICGDIEGCTQEQCRGGECIALDIDECSDDVDGCCSPLLPDGSGGCSIGTDIDCTGRGHVVFVGHDFYQRNSAGDSVIANAVFNMANPADGTSIRVLAYTQYADNTATGEVANTNAALSAQAESRGISWSRSVLSNYTSLSSRTLAGYDVLLVYEQENGEDPMLAAVGAFWRPFLPAWVQAGGVIVVMEDGGGGTWRILSNAGVMNITGIEGASGTTLRFTSAEDPIAWGFTSSTYTAVPDSGAVVPVDITGAAVRTSDEAARPVVVRRGGALVAPPVNIEGHSTLSVTSGTTDEGQFNLNIRPLSFPFNGERYGCVSVSTNGYLRFGPHAGCPAASGSTDADTDIDDAYAAGTAQVSFLAANAEVSGDLFYRIEPTTNRVVFTLLDFHGRGRPLTTHVQIVLYCDTGDIQMIYGEATFDLASSDHWSFGVSEPALEGGMFHGTDFASFTDADRSRFFGPGAVGQAPERSGTGGFRVLDNMGILFHRLVTGGWEVIVDSLPPTD